MADAERRDGQPGAGDPPPGFAADVPLEGLAVATMFRGELTQLLQWCNLHLSAGVARIYVVLDEPSPSQVATLPDHPRIHCEVIGRETWHRFYVPGGDNVERKQVDAFRWIARQAERDGHRHVAFIDTDEVLDLREPFLDVAARFPDAAALTVRGREMWFDGSRPITEPFGARLAVRKGPRRDSAWREAFGWRAQFLRGGMLGHEAGKTVYRLPLASGAISVHQPLTGALLAGRAVVPDASGRLLHFDCGSVATWNAKWAARYSGGTFAAGLEGPRRAQQTLFEDVLRSAPHEQERFFEQFFTLAPSQATRLESAGMVERVDVGPALHGPLEVDAARPQPALAQLPARAPRVDHQFALVCDRRFVKPAFATMTSVVAQMGGLGSLRFVVLGDGLDNADIRRLRSLEHTPWDVQVSVHDISADLDRDVGTEDQKRATFGRIYLIDYLPEQRTVYLDGDVLATRDVSELFTIDLDGACLAGVADSAALRLLANPAGVPLEQRTRLLGITDGDSRWYLNGGVLVLDLDNPDFRELALRARALVVQQGRALKQRDQDALNLAFAGRKHLLASTYNYMTQFFVSDRCLDGDLARLKYAAADASLIHFSGKVKPWESADEEFYNGLYRQLVSSAEETVGVSCDFYFSKPAPPHEREWSLARWRAELEAPERPERPAVSPRASDVELLDVSDSAVYLKLSATMFEHVRSTKLRLLARCSGEVVFDLPLTGLGAQQVHLGTRVGTGVRVLPVDLPATLASNGGVCRRVEVVLAAPDSSDYERSLAVVDVLACGSGHPDLLSELGADGEVESPADGWVRGWYRSASDLPISLRIGDELVALRLPSAGEDGARRFKFPVRHLRNLGYGANGAEVSVRLAATNVALRRVVPAVMDPAAGGLLTADPPPEPAGLGRIVQGFRDRLRDVRPPRAR